MMLARINLGCGRTPTPGWSNFDNSPTIRLAQLPFAVEALSWAGILNHDQLAFARVARDTAIRWADAARRIPLPDASASAAYSSHMVEHLAPGQARSFLAEVRRVLAPGGVLRLALPDLRKLAADYARDGNADRFVNRTLLAEAPRTRARVLRTLLFGARNHAWMYDGKSLRTLLGECGYREVVELPPGQTTIPDPGALDLREREDESVYVEGTK